MEVLLEGEASGTLVRLIGVNAPELNGGGAAAACHAEEARTALQGLLSDDPIYLCTDVEETDRYQRVLAYAYAQDPLRFINLQLLEGGSACAYPFPPNTRHRDSFEAAEESARRSALGVWGLCPDGCGQP